MNSDSRLKIVFFGTPEFSARCLETLLKNPTYKVTLVVTQPDRPAGRGKQLQSSPVKHLALSEQIPLLQPKSIRKIESEFLAEMKKFGPFDLGIVVAFGQILPISVLHLPRAHSVNVHASLLPRWRGAAPIQRAIMAGDRKTGICLMDMEAGLDTGAVYAREEVEIMPQDNFQSLHDRLAEIGSRMLNKELVNIADGATKSILQEGDGVTYAQRISNEEAKIDWSFSAQDLINKVRGLSPFPGAFSHIEGKRIKIFRAEAKSELPSSQKFEAGQVVLVEQTHFEVKCADAVISVQEAQVEGRKRMPVNELLKGFEIKPGMRLE